MKIIQTNTWLINKDELSYDHMKTQWGHSRKDDLGYLCQGVYYAQNPKAEKEAEKRLLKWAENKLKELYPKKIIRVGMKQLTNKRGMIQDEMGIKVYYEKPE